MLLTNTMDYSQPITGFSEKLSFGGMMVLVGMLAVFSVLAIIWLALVIFKAVFNSISTKKENAATKTEVVVPEAPATVADPDEEIVAVIAAAIAMAESESDGIKFKVVSFRRV